MLSEAAGKVIIPDTFRLSSRRIRWQVTVGTAAGTDHVSRALVADSKETLWICSSRCSR